MRIDRLLSGSWPNRLLGMDTQHLAAASRHLLRAGQLRRQAGPQR
jgi:hypothetical protein